ncbi:vancomycin resistance protein [bacterium LRH843]|nr:vancomycin resistance protein [bacterium LRH843]
MEEVKLVKEHDSFLVEQQSKKAPVYWAVSLKNAWSGEVYSVVMNDYGYFHDDQYNEEALRELAHEIAAEIDSPMQHPKLGEEGQLIPGKARIILSEKELVDLLKTLPVGIPEALLPVYITEPNVSEEEMQGIDEQIIGQYKTYFNPQVTGRSQNILLSAQEISNVVLGPGDQFSFNQTVGERTVERGYQEALEIINKEFVMGIGGGICQTSSTLFNAVEAAGLEIIERFTHSKSVGYVAEGRDATVSWGGPDFRFSNPFSFPVLIRTDVNLKRGEMKVIIHTHKS